MEQETLHQRYLVVFALILCAVIVLYNVFYVPDVSLSNVTVSIDASSGQPFENSSVLSSDEEYVPSAVSSGDFSGAGSKSISSKAAASGGKINLNTATAQQLSDGLNGVGEVLAKRIVDYRETHGRFQSVSELKNVTGIGEKLYAKIQNQVTVGD